MRVNPCVMRYLKQEIHRGRSAHGLAGDLSDRTQTSYRLLGASSDGCVCDVKGGSMNGVFMLMLASLLVVTLPLGWLTTNILSRMSGWRDLAREYRTDDAVPSGAILASVRVGKVLYPSMLRIARNSEGVYLHMAGLFRWGHPPLRIPRGVLEERDTRDDIDLGLAQHIEVTDPQLALWVPVSVWKPATPPSD